MQTRDGVGNRFNLGCLPGSTGNGDCQRQGRLVQVVGVCILGSVAQFLPVIELVLIENVPLAKVVADERETEPEKEYTGQRPERRGECDEEKWIRYGASIQSPVQRPGE